MKTSAFLLILLTMLFVSCRKDKSSENTGTSDQFPNSPGDYWKYSIKSLTGEQKGVLEVSIINKKILSNGKVVTTWIYSYPEFTDTVYKVMTNSSLTEYHKFPEITEDNYPFMRYDFPLDPGRKWAIYPSPYTDSVRVLKDTTINVPAGSFDNTAKLDFISTHSIVNYNNASLYWFTPYVGITRMKYAVYNLGFDEYSGIYELQEYRLK
jgi:hypothetical protein